MSRWWNSLNIRAELNVVDVLNSIEEDDIRKYLDYEQLSKEERIKFNRVTFDYDIDVNINDIIDEIDSDDLIEEIENRGYQVDPEIEYEDFDELGEQLTKLSWNDFSQVLRSFMKTKRMNKDMMIGYFTQFIQDL